MTRSSLVKCLSLVLNMALIIGTSLAISLVSIALGYLVFAGILRIWPGFNALAAIVLSYLIGLGLYRLLVAKLLNPVHAALFLSGLDQQPPAA